MTPTIRGQAEIDLRFLAQKYNATFATVLEVALRNLYLLDMQSGGTLEIRASKGQHLNKRPRRYRKKVSGEPEVLGVQSPRPRLDRT